MHVSLVLLLDLEKLNIQKNPKKNDEIEKEIRKRTLLCSRSDFPESKEYNSEDENSKKERNRASQRCGCSFYIRASLNNTNGLWYIISMDLVHNHQMVNKNHRIFMSSERHIPDDIKQRIELLHRAGVDVPTIRAILKEEFGDHVTWMYDDIYNFIYHLEGSPEKKELDAEEFTKILEQFKYVNDEDLYKFFGEMDISNFLTQWDALKTLYPLAVAYLSRMEKMKEKWAACFNCDTFIADMTTTQHGESMNNMMKGYLDANTSLTAFILAFQSALDVQNEKTEFWIYQQNNFNITYKTTSLYKHQAASILTTYSLKKT
ncbi:21731_t:CDS:2 [Gigaspora margarita]|uniref:21731_t:CDS:1 n=1 Tax=Gigaspora margarita TaxID=4874 RepID=A0ABN7UVY2_GIGMA|nr:21731_t:CDS:2 [Gigaspora margarita]